MHPSGADRHCITNEDDWASGSFSPDGSKIVTGRTPAPGDVGNQDVYVLNVDGSGEQNVTQSPRFDSAPDWGPRRR